MINLIKIHKVRLEIIYRIIMKRIAKGYTAEQLSAILGRPPEYITSLEMLQIPLCNEYELQEIAWALGEDKLSNLFPKITQSIILNVLMEKEMYGTTYIHSCDIITDDDKEVPYFFLQEEIVEKAYVFELSD